MIFWFTTRGEVGLSGHYVDKLEKWKKLPDIYWHDPIHGVNKGDLTISQPSHLFCCISLTPLQCRFTPQFPREVTFLPGEGEGSWNRQQSSFRQLLNLQMCFRIKTNMPKIFQKKINVDCTIQMSAGKCSCNRIQDHALMHLTAHQHHPLLHHYHHLLRTILL